MIKNPISCFPCLGLLDSIYTDFDLNEYAFGNATVVVKGPYIVFVLIEFFLVDASYITCFNVSYFPTVYSFCFVILTSNFILFYSQ
jgi:hypothetical protein